MGDLHETLGALRIDDGQNVPVDESLVSHTDLESDCSTSPSSTPSNVGTRISISASSTILPGEYRRLFAKPLEGYDDNVILLTGDGVRFIYPLSILAKHSKFFEAIAGLASAVDDSGDREMPLIEMEHATSDGLALVIQASVESGSVKVDLRDCEESAKLVEAVKTADAYDFETFRDLDLLVIPFRAEGFPDTFVSFALAVAFASSSRHYFREIATRTLCNGTDISDMDEDALAVLTICNTNHLERLRQFHQRRKEWLADLADILESSWKTYNGFDDFGQFCRGVSSWSMGQTCEAYNTVEGDFMALRRQAAAPVTVAIGLRPSDFYDCQENDVRPYLEDIVPCQRCRTRLTRTFQMGLRAYEGLLQFSQSESDL